VISVFSPPLAEAEKIQVAADFRKVKDSSAV